MARFYGIRAKETGQNLNECTRIVNELPRMNRSTRIHLDLPVYRIHVPGSSALKVDRSVVCGRARTFVRLYTEFSPGLAEILHPGG